MSAVEALKAARAVGVELALDGDDLVLEAASAPPVAVLEALSRHKTEVVALLSLAAIGISALVDCDNEHLVERLGRRTSRRT